MIPIILIISITGSVEKSVITPNWSSIIEKGIAKIIVDARSALLTLAFPKPRERIYKTYAKNVVPIVSASKRK
jgi:hypothetical protein